MPPRQVISIEELADRQWYIPATNTIWKVYPGTPQRRHYNVREFCLPNRTLVYNCYIPKGADLALYRWGEHVEHCQYITINSTRITLPLELAQEPQTSVEKATLVNTNACQCERPWVYGHVEGCSKL